MAKRDRGRKSATRFHELLSAAAAVVWSLNCLFLARYAGEQAPPAIILVLNMAGAVIWWVTFVTALVRYEKGGQNK